MLTKKDAVAADFFQKYISAAKDDEVLKALKKNTRSFKKLLDSIPKKKAVYAYGKDKWTLNELLQHLVDAERVFSYRALRIARKDTTPLAGFDQDNWAANAQVNNRNWTDLVKEFKAVRKSTELLFESLQDDQLLSVGIAGGHEINTLALGFISAGHVEHHSQIIKERYL